MVSKSDYDNLLEKKNELLAENNKLKEVLASERLEKNRLSNIVSALNETLQQHINRRNCN